jgi:uncharacterized protein (TIGR03437 family)
MPFRRVLLPLLAPILLAGAVNSLPAHFEPRENGFLVRTGNSTYLLSETGALRFSPQAEMKFAGASAAARAEPFRRLPGKTNYLRGADPAQWRTGVPQFGGVRYANLLPGIDLIYHADSKLEYDLWLSPRVSPRRIVMEFSGAQTVRLDRDGGLIATDGAAELRLGRPRISQDGRAVSGGYRLLSARRVAFRIGNYDRNRPLLIDPVIGAFNTLAITILGVAADAAGNVYIASNSSGGGNSSATLPLVNALQPNLGSGSCVVDTQDPFPEPCQDVFVAKLDPTATQIIYSTFLGDNGFDSVAGLAVDALGNAYLAATSYPPGPYFQPPTGSGHAFVRKLSPDGSALLYDTSLGANTQAAQIALDASGNAYLAGTSFSASFAAVNAIQSQTVITPMYVTKDGGATWNPVHAPATTVNMLAIPPGSSTTLYAATSSGLLKSLDGGTTWTNLIPTAVAATIVVLDPKTPSTVYAVYAAPPVNNLPSQIILTRSMDSGATWNILNGIPGIPPTSALPMITAVAIDPENSSTIWIAAGPFGGVVDKSLDGGVTWQIVYGQTLVPPPFPFAPSGLLIDPTNSAHVYACCANRGGGGVFFTQDGGVTWVEGAAGPVAGSGGIHAPVLDPANPFLLYATWYYGLDSSPNGGQSWTAINLPPVPQNLNNVLIDPSGIVYTASDAGYFLRSPDRGAAWTLTPGPWGTGATVLAIDPAQSNTVYVSSPQSQIQDAFAAKLNSAGNTVWATLLGGSGADSGQGVAVDAKGNVYLAGVTSSTDFPVLNAVQTQLGNGIGTGSDGFVAEISANGAQLLYSTYLGGSQDELGVSVAADASGEAFVAGLTMSADFPLVNPISTVFSEQNTNPYGLGAGFVAKIAAGGRSLLFSTFFPSIPFALRVDSMGAPWLGGAAGLELPMVQPVQASAGLGVYAGFLSQLTPSGSALQFSTYLCGEVDSLALTSGGSAWVAGWACPDDLLGIGASTALPLGSFARIDPAPPAAQPGVPRIDAVYDGAAFEWGNVIAPGEVVTLLGAELAASAQSASTTPLPVSLSDVSVTVGGTPAPLYYASPAQINFQAPTNLALGPADLAVTRGANVTHRAVNIVPARPGIFSVNGVPAITHASDFSLVTAANPAHPGEYLAVFCSGLGPVNPSILAGQPAPLAQLQTPAVAVVGGLEINVQYAGLAPGSIGLYQVNFQLPSNAALELTDLYILINSSGRTTNDVLLYVQ